MKKIKLFFLIIFFLLFCSTLFSQTWLSDYAYRKQITISGSSGAGIDYQVLLKVGESSGSSGADFHIENHALNFPNDIRFTDDDETTELSHWFEQTTGSSPNRIAYFWVRVTDNLDTNKDIYIYYSKSGVSSGSNGDETFLFYDHFEGTTLNTSKWQLYTGSGYTISGSNINFPSSSADPGIRTINTFFLSSGDYVFESRFRITGGSNTFNFGVSQPFTGGEPYNPIRSLQLCTTCGNSSYDFRDHGNITYYSVGKDAENNWRIWAFGYKYNTLAFTRLYNETRTATLKSHNQTTNLSPTNTFTTIHFKSFTKSANVDWIIVRKYASTQPSFSSALSEEIPVWTPTVTNSTGASDITPTSATLNGEITDDGGEDPIVIIYYGLSNGGTNSGSWTYSVNLGTRPLGVFSTNVTDLIPGATYYYRCCAENSADSDWADETTSFPTPTSPPTVTSPTHSDITATSAILGATVVSDGGLSILERGTCWGTLPDPSTNCYPEGGTSTGSYNHLREGLSPGTTVFYRGYATNSDGTAYSEDSSFLTLPAGIVIDWNNGNVQTITLQGDADFVFINGQPGATYKLVIQQDEVGGRDITFPEYIKWFEGILPISSSEPNEIDVAIIICIASDEYLGFFYRDFR